VLDPPPCDEVCGALEEHVRRCFAGHEVDASRWDIGPILSVNPHLRVLRVAPRSAGGVWTYVSIGGWAATADRADGIEFVLSTPTDATARAAELLAMTVHYHQGGTLGLGHTVPIGHPWLRGSGCDHLLVSLPYPFGPELEHRDLGDRHVRFRWLLPITKAERDYKQANGLEALERAFDAAALKYWDVGRNSVV